MPRDGGRSRRRPGCPPAPAGGDTVGTAARWRTRTRVGDTMGDTGTWWRGSREGPDPAPLAPPSPGRQRGPQGPRGVGAQPRVGAGPRVGARPPVSVRSRVGASTRGCWTGSAAPAPVPQPPLGARVGAVTAPGAGGAGTGQGCLPPHLLLLTGVPHPGVHRPPRPAHGVVPRGRILPCDSAQG